MKVISLPPITLFDSYLKREVSTTKNTLKIYSCGPTVYQYQHIGNMRAVWLPDTVVRVAKLAGYEVEWVLNITDVGHLVGDGDDGQNTNSGEDKLEKSAKKEGKQVEEIVKHYVKDFHVQCSKLGFSLPQGTFQPKATQYIEEQMILALSLLKEHKAYVSEDGIYFDSVANAHLEVPFTITHGDHAFTGRDIKGSTKNPNDFALWKFVDENSLQKWRFNEFDSTASFLISILESRDADSILDLPNRFGCPGWHSECVAMICKILDGSFPPSQINDSIIDLHFGGEDHIDIHHKNEMLQSEALGFHLSKHWVHNKFVLVDGKKMSKSVGNVYLVSGEKETTGFESLEEKGFNPLSYRMMLFEHHYSQQLDFTWEKLSQSQARLNGLKKDIAKIRSFAGTQIENTTQIPDSDKANSAVTLLLSTLLNNLNTPLFLEKYQDLIGDLLQEVLTKKTIHNKNLETLQIIDSAITGFELFPEIPQDVIDLANQRSLAKEQKDFSSSDEIRDSLKIQGWQIDDNSWGYSLWKI
jgi:cysteinyl-tRNA synthetase